MNSKPIEIFRLENIESNHGMWYNKNGDFDPFITRLTEGKSADLPMGYNPRYRTEGLEWFSGTDNIEDMKHWFSERDALELFQNGYKLYVFDALHVLQVEHETMFTKASVLDKREIPLDTIWNINKLAKSI
jgi:hypothetical protein